MSEVVDYDSVAALGASLDRPIHTLLALTPQNDPFNAGRPARRQDAEWFAELWRKIGCGPGTHLRRVHYLLVSQAEHVIATNGEPYLNTQDCWGRLVVASRDARYLGLVPVEHFVDRRNDDVIEHFDGMETTAEVSVSEPASVLGTFSSGLFSYLPDAPEFQFIPPVVSQRYHIELWAEKASMNDVLERLARTYGLNVVTASGEISVTHCHQLVQRATEIGRPVRILYVSDFDPAGRSIPVACARKIEFFIARDNLDLDVQVRPVALTDEQCVEFRLPRTPIKPTENRAAEFEARYGEGATELDALEALRPGVLRQILEREILRYHDSDLDDRVAETAQAFKEDLFETRRQVLARHRDELEEIRLDYQDLTRRANPELKRIKKRFDKSLGDIRERFDSLQRTIADELEEEAPDPDTVEWPEPEEGDEDDDPLFDSTRGYVEQIDRFKEHQGKPITRRERKAATP